MFLDNNTPIAASKYNAFAGVGGALSGSLSQPRDNTKNFVKPESATPQSSLILNLNPKQKS